MMGSSRSPRWPPRWNHPGALQRQVVHSWAPYRPKRRHGLGGLDGVLIVESMLAAPTPSSWVCYSNTYNAPGDGRARLATFWGDGSIIVFSIESMLARRSRPPALCRRSQSAPLGATSSERTISPPTVANQCSSRSRPPTLIDRCTNVDIGCASTRCSVGTDSTLPEDSHDELLSESTLTTHGRPSWVHQHRHSAPQSVRPSERPPPTPLS